MPSALGRLPRTSSGSGCLRELGSLPRATGTQNSHHVPMESSGSRFHRDHRRLETAAVTTT